MKTESRSALIWHPGDHTQGYSMNKMILALVLGFMVAACGDPEPQTATPDLNYKSVSGTVVFRERIGLTPESRMEVELKDVSLSDVLATVVATAAIDHPGQSPIAFTIEYDASQVDDRHSYSIGARVLDRGQLILVSDSISPALTRNAPAEVKVFVVRVSQNKYDQPEASIADTEWLLSTVNGRQVARRDRGPDIQLTLDSKTGAVSGYAGCNRFKGSYQLQGNKLGLGDLAVTAMACESGGDVESEFLKALAELSEVRVSGRTLLGYKEGALVASFEADPLR